MKLQERIDEAVAIIDGLTDILLKRKQTIDIKEFIGYLQAIRETLLDLEND